MNKNKSKKILIAIIILLTLIAITIGGIAFAYFATDIFKTDKEMFFKYASQIFEEDGFIEKSISTYYEKQKSTPYTNEGTITAEIVNDELEEKLKKANDFYISFVGKVDAANSKSQQEINLNYTDNVKFPLNYRQEGKKIGLQTEYVGSKYIAIKNDDTEEIFEQININADAINEIENLVMSQEEISNLMNKYSNIINQYLSVDKFTKIAESNNTGYKLTLKGQDIKQILLAILENAKTDETILKKLNEIAELQDLSTTINAEQIDELINQLNSNTEIEQLNIEISLYNNNGMLNRIIININEKVKIEATKSTGADEVQYNVKFSAYENNEETVNINIGAEYTGFQTLETVSENYEIGFQHKNEYNTVAYKYIYDNKVSFTNNVDIEDINENNSIILNDQEEEYVTNLMQAILERIQLVNKDQMEEIGLAESENPMIYWFSWIPKLLMTSSGVDVNNNTELNQQIVETFNNKFLIYQSTNTKGATAKGLLTVIQANNEESDTKITEINFDGEEYEVTEQNITLIKSNILVEEAYKIEFEYDRETGMIYRVIINKK